jgi:hypothetical protein
LIELLVWLVGAVLSDKGKKAMYDAGLFDPLDDDDQVNQQSISVSFLVLFFLLFFSWFLLLICSSNSIKSFCHFVREYYMCIMHPNEKKRKEKKLIYLLCSRTARISPTSCRRCW